MKDYAFGLVGGIAALVATPFVLSWMGFTAAGVAAGSIAASIQSFMYGGAVGSTSIFAVFQSIGAVGMSTKVAVGIVTAFGGFVTYIKSIFAPCGEGPKCSSDQE